MFLSVTCILQIGAYGIPAVGISCKPFCLCFFAWAYGRNAVGSYNMLSCQRIKEEKL